MSDKEKLKSFISILRDKIGFSFDMDDFDDRLKLQKYVFIAKSFGFKHNYGYNLYIRGPYSSKLADDYFDIFRNNEMVNNVPLNIDTDSFSVLVHDKDVIWLEAAATMLSLYSTYPENYKTLFGVNYDRLIEETKTIKHKISEDIIKSVCNDLREAKLFN